MNHTSIHQACVFSKQCQNLFFQTVIHAKVVWEAKVKCDEIPEM